VSIYTSKKIHRFKHVSWECWMEWDGL